MVFTSSWKFLALFTLLCYISAATSKFRGVTWDKRTNKWRAVMTFTKNGKSIYKQAGMFKNELDAAKALNQLCEKYGMEHKNWELNGIPQKEKKIHHQYFGVSHRNDVINNQWGAVLCIGKNKIYGGAFATPEKAAKQVNAMCKKYGLEKKNPELSSDEEIEVTEKNKKTSKYFGVGYLNCIGYRTNRWRTELIIDGVRKRLGNFDTEMNAAKHINKICKKLGWPKKNADLSSSEDNEKEHKFLNQQK